MKSSISYSVFLVGTMLLITTCKPETSINGIDNFNEFQFLEYTITDFQEAYNEGSLTISEVVAAYLDRIDQIDSHGPDLNSVITVNPDALEIASNLDKELREGKVRGLMHGIPVLLKDNIDTKDKMPCTAGSRALKDSYPLQDSYVAKALRNAGAVIIGKANLSEWANFRGDMSTSGWSGLGGQTKNPYILDRNPCGSSSGSGAAVSANLTVIAIGTETNGSIVCPSHANGIVGIKPTVGLVSRSGIIPISFTQDTPGPMARTVTDAAICLSVLTGIDSTDNKTLASNGQFHTDYTPFLKSDGLKGKRIGVFKKPFGINYKVDSLMTKTMRHIENQGAELIEVEKILGDQTGYYSFEVMLFEYKDGLNNYFTSLGENAAISSINQLIEFNKKDSIELMHFNQQYLEMAAEKGSLESKEFKDFLVKASSESRELGIDKIMKEHNLDAIIAPTGAPAWKTDRINGDSYHLGSSSPAAIAGYPNITVPMGFIDDLPVGISFFGGAWSEPTLIEIAYSFEQSSKVRTVPEFLNN